MSGRKSGCISFLFPATGPTTLATLTFTIVRDLLCAIQPFRGEASLFTHLDHDLSPISLIEVHGHKIPLRMGVFYNIGHGFVEERRSFWVFVARRGLDI